MEQHVLLASIAKSTTKLLGYKYYLQYNFIKIKRLLLHTVIIFLLQFSVIASLPFPCAGIAMYPPTAIAFLMFYLLGGVAFYGIFLSSLCGYLLQELSPACFCGYMLADLGAGFFAVVFGKDFFATDVRILLDWQAVAKFIKVNAFIIVMFTSLLKMLALIVDNKIDPSFKNLSYTFLHLWLADLNAILILSGFLLSWLYVPFSREQIATRKITKLQVVLLLALVVTCMLFMQRVELIYLLVTAMLLAIYLAKTYGHLVATLLLFILSSIYIAYFLSMQVKYAKIFKEFYSVLPAGGLFVFTIALLYLGHYTLRQDKN